MNLLALLFPRTNEHLLALEHKLAALEEQVGAIKVPETVAVFAVGKSAHGFRPVRCVPEAASGVAVDVKEEILMQCCAEAIAHCHLEYDVLCGPRDAVHRVANRLDTRKSKVYLEDYPNVDVDGKRVLLVYMDHSASWWAKQFEARGAKVVGLAMVIRDHHICEETTIKEAMSGFEALSMVALARAY